ncbi:hypothetical protein [Paraburkholderia agricolaris]|uniref:hypothetical protein n=1 Tax=Paraburkholderia agricolaris TaxID=2152888 RepID=UPI00129167A8|nr:hypothetical protein [Paraburkholderia agricolaris]
MALRYDDLAKDGVVQINGKPLKTCDDQGRPLDANRIYDQMIDDLNSSGPKFAKEIGAWRIFDSALMQLMKPGAENIVTESFAGTPVTPAGQPSRAINLVPYQNGFLIHTRLSYERADQNGKEICFDNQPALEIHLRHVVEFDHGDNVLMRVANRIKDSGIDNRTATCYFLSADAVTPSPELRASLVERSASILDRLIDFFSQLFDTPRYEIYSPNRSEKVRLLDSTPKLTPSTAELQADGAQVRVAGLIPEDQHVRISHVHREAFHHRTLDVGSRGHSMTAHLKINAFADFAFDEQRKLVLEKQNELHEQDQTLTAENAVYQRFEALNLDRLIARARRGDTGESIHSMIRRIRDIPFEFGSQQDFEEVNNRKNEPRKLKIWRKGDTDPNSLLNAAEKKQLKEEADEKDKQSTVTQSRITFYVDAEIKDRLDVSPNAKVGIQSIQEQGGPVATYLLIQRILTAFEKQVPSIGVDAEVIALEHFATLTKDLFIKKTVSDLFDVLAQIHKQFYDVDNSPFATLPALKEREFQRMSRFVEMLYTVHSGQKLEDPNTKISFVPNHTPQKVDKEEVARVSILLGLQP